VEGAKLEAVLTIYQPGDRGTFS